MKFTASIATIILATAFSANAAPNANPDPWCHWVGQPCGKMKRAADAFAEALAVSGPTDAALAARCESGACYEAKMRTRDLAALVAETTEDPTAYYNSLGLEAPTVNGKREAEPWCHWVGQPCGKKTKRDAVADPDAEAYCHWVGQPCGKMKRAAEAIAEALAVADAEPAPWCQWVGQPCGKAKRDAYALAHAANEILNN